MRFIETAVFTSVLRRHLPDEEYRALQLTLVLRPDQGKLIPRSGVFGNSGGKLRVAESAVGLGLFTIGP
jgi:hypothetical protein